MIEISKVQYDLIAVTSQGEGIHLNTLMTSLSWEEQPSELAARLTAQVQDHKFSNYWIHTKLPLAGHTLLRANWGSGWNDIHKGVIFNWEYKGDPLPSLSTTAYDNLIYLMKSKDDRYYANGTKAKTILTDIAKAWGISLGKVDGPDVALAKQVFRGQMVSDMMLSVLDQAEKRGAGKFIIRYANGKIDIIKRGTNTTIYHFGQEDNVQQISDQQSLDQLITRVKIIGAQDKSGKSAVVATVDGQTQFGILQDIVYREQYDTEAAAKKAAQSIIDQKGNPKKTRTIVAPDLPFTRRGDKIHITAGTLNGYYIVSGISHEANTRTMTLEVEDV